MWLCSWLSTGCSKGVSVERPVQLVNIFNAPVPLMAPRRLLVVAEQGASLRLLHGEAHTLYVQSVVGLKQPVDCRLCVWRAPHGLFRENPRIVAAGVNALKTNDNATIVITHYQRLLDYIVLSQDWCCCFIQS